MHTLMDLYPASTYLSLPYLTLKRPYMGIPIACNHFDGIKLMRLCECEVAFLRLDAANSPLGGEVAVELK